MTELAVSQQPEIKQITKKVYVAAVRGLQRHSSAQRTTNWEIPAQASYLEMAKDLSEREDVAHRSKKTYRAALLWHIVQYPSDPDIDRSAIELLQSLFRTPGPKPKSAKPQTISEEDFALLVSELGEMGVKGVWARRAQHWVVATLSTGLRPREWVYAQWANEQKTVLAVTTGKVKISRPAYMRKTHPFAGDWPTEEEYAAANAATGPKVREIPVPRIADQLSIAAHLLDFNVETGDGMSEEKRLELFEGYYRHCKQSINRACFRTWEGQKSYNLVTMRSQFSANQKAALGRDATAALMGHVGADSPAAAHYGKGNQAHRRFKGLRQTAGNDQAQEAVAPQTQDPSGITDVGM